MPDSSNEPATFRLPVGVQRKSYAPPSKKNDRLMLLMKLLYYMIAGAYLGEGALGHAPLPLVWSEKYQNSLQKRIFNNFRFYRVQAQTVANPELILLK